MDHTGQGENQARNRYEFGDKVSLAIPQKQGLIVGTKRFVSNRFDGMGTSWCVDAYLIRLNWMQRVM